MNKLSLLVEGQGDSQALPTLVTKIIEQFPDHLHNHVLMGNPEVIGAISDNAAKRNIDWLRALRRQHSRGYRSVLAVFDGDEDYFEGEAFCPFVSAATLAMRAIEVGAGKTFSLAVVVICKEYESILIASASQFTNFLKLNPIPVDVESSPRDAKRWIQDNIFLDGRIYNEVVDQKRLTTQITSLDTIRRSMRSFRRLESALMQLFEAANNDKFVVSPLVAIE